MTQDGNNNEPQSMAIQQEFSISRERGELVIPMPESEKVIGELVVNATLVQGQERLRLIFTPIRVIVARLGKRGIGGAASSSFLGRMGTGLEDLVVSGKERAKRQG